MTQNPSVQCILFASTFTGLAARWFVSLPAQSIDSFNELCSIFLKHFYYNIQTKKDPSALFGVLIRRGESLSDYVKRFQAEMGEIEVSEHDSTIVDAFTQGLRDAVPDTAAHRCYEKLCGKRPDDLTEMMLKVKQYTTGEAHLRPQEVKSKKVSVAEEPRKRRHDKLTPTVIIPLKQELSSILPIYETMPEYKPARPIRYNRPPDSRQFCQYHKQHGHDIDRCYSLRDKVNKLVLDGKLSQF